MLRAVHLHGRLGKRFGRRFDLAVDSATEAVRALTFQIPGFADYIRHRGYVVTVGEHTALDQESLDLRLGGGSDIHIIPAGAVSGIETIILGGMLLFAALASVAAILMMPKVPKAATREEATKTASFIFDGAQNVTEQGHPVPLVYGRFRVGSVVVSAGIATTDVNEASVSADPTNPAYGGGGGGTYDGYVGSTPGIDGSPYGREWIALDKGGKGSSGSSRSAQEDPNTLQSQATAKVLEVVSEGEIVGLVDGLKSVYFDSTPLQNPDGTFNFAGVAVEQRFGLPDQDFIPGFSQAENSRDIDTKVSVALGPVTRSINDEDVTVARVTIRLPQLYQQNTENGDLKASTVSVKVSVQADGGGFTDVTTIDFTGKTNSGYQRSVDIRLPNGVQRDIRVTRVTPDSTVASLSNETRWDLLTEIVEAKLSYPDTALMGLTVDARQFGSSIPTRSYDIKGLIIEVPTNYDPETRAYAGIWDGTFKRAWTDNPAWVLRDLIVNRRYGLGARVPASAVDVWGLYAIAQYCDGLVPDGFGGTRPRYTVNCCINNPASAYDVIATICSVFRGWAYWGSGSIIAAQDRPEDPSILITRSNVVDGKISYGRATPHEKRRSVAIVYWNDPEDGFRLVPEIEEDPELIRRFGRRAGEEVTAFGVTNQGQANFMARWLLEDEKPSSNSTAAYEVGDDHSFVEPGRVAAVADPMFTQNRRGGRVRAATAGAVTLDSPYPFVDGQNYALRVMLPTGEVSLRAITNGPGTTAVVTLAGADWVTPPNPGSVWAVESDTVANRQFRVRQITTDEAPYSVQAVLHDPTKYERVELDRDISSPNFLEVADGPLLAPHDIVAMEFLLGDGSASVPCTQVSWSPPADPRVAFYQAQFRRPGGSFEPLADSLDVSRVVRGVEAGDWTFRVRSLDSLGRKTEWVEKTVTLDAQIDAIPNVTGLTVNVNNAALQSMLAWVNPVDHRPLRYEILFDAAGVFANADQLAVVNTQEYPVSQIGTYWVRTVFLNALADDPPGVLVEAGDLPTAPNIANQGDLATMDLVGLGAGGQVTREDGSTRVTDAAAITALGSAASIAGQGALATQSQVNLGATGSVYRDDGSTRLTDALAVTNLGTAAAIASQGALATLSQVQWGSAGRVYRDDGSTRVTDALAITQLGTAAGIASQGALATASQVNLGAGGRVYREDGTTRLTDALAVTSLGTASSIAGQGAFATVSSAAYGSSYLTGFGTLAPRNNVRIANELLLADGVTATSDAGLVTSLGTAASIASQGALATRNNARLGTEVYRADGTTVLTDALAVTSLGTASAIAGQGAFATVSSAAYGSSLLTGFGALAPRSEVYFGDTYLRESTGGTSATLANFKTGLGTAASITGQGTLATRSTARLGTEVYRADGTTVLTDALAVTSLGTASAIASQGALATANQVQWGSTGRVYRDDGVTRVTDASSITALGTAASIASQGSFATLSQTYFGDGLLKETSGGATATLANFKTSSGTAASIASQGALATASQVNWGSTGRVYRDDGVTRVTDASSITSLGTAASIASQGSFATLSQTYFGDGLLKETSGGTTATLANFKTSSGTAAAITGQGTLATRSSARLGTEVYRADGTTVLTDALAVTSLGTASAITGQGALATVSVADWSTQIAGTGKPADGATNNPPGAALNSNDSFEAWNAANTVPVGWPLLYYGTLARAASTSARRGQWSARVTGKTVLDSDLIPVTAGERIFLHVGFQTVTNDTAGAVRTGGSWAFGCRLYNAAGAGVGNAFALVAYETAYTVAQGAQDIGTWYTVAAGVAAIRLIVAFEDTDAASNAVGEVDWFSVLRHQPQADVTALGTAASIASQGALATISQVNLGASGRVYRDDGVTRVTDALAITALGTAAAIVGQGTLATLGAVDLEGATVINKTRISKLAASTGVANDSTILPSNVALGLIPSLKSLGSISDTDNTGTVTLNIGSSTFQLDNGSTVTFPSSTLGGKSYGTLYYIKRTGVDPVNSPTGTAYNASTTLSIGVGEVYINYYTTRASGAVPSPPPPPPPGGGSGCPWEDAEVETRDRGWVPARDIVPHQDWGRVLTDDRCGTRWERFLANEPATGRALRLVTRSGATLTVSESTPLTLQDGSSLPAPAAAGEQLPVHGSTLSWDECEAVQDRGTLPVRRLSCSGYTFSARDPGTKLGLLTHNYDKP